MLMILPIQINVFEYRSKEFDNFLSLFVDFIPSICISKDTMGFSMEPLNVIGLCAIPFEDAISCLFVLFELNYELVTDCGSLGIFTKW